ncbi:MAG: phage Gp37/Gp68 family protein [Deltaproteobacteria bacterium]|nr:phage Gp37/Gp68 family protein [Deltaproteobacteria bacterium]
MLTGIEWTDRTWNPVTGCTKISAGCKHCYAESLAKRLHAMGNARYLNGFALALHPDKLREPAKWREPTRVFVNSMSDLLHEDVPDAFVMSAFATMIELAPHHTYQILTKRPERWASISDQVIVRWGRWPRNVWPGATVENRKALPRLEALACAGDHETIRMVSAEPLLESLVGDGGVIEDLAERLCRARIGWLISGGEAGFKARPASLDWFRELRDACYAADVAYFHKQHGGTGVTKKAKSGGADALLDGVLHHAWPH